MAYEPTQDGTVSFSTPLTDTPCHTYFKIFGDVRRGKTPLIILHGGPGSGHEYCLPFSRLWLLHQIPVVFYDQIGCAASTHLRHKAGDQSFWQPELFIDELQNFLDHIGLGPGEGRNFDVLGHSWGGILATAFAFRRPSGLRRLIIMGSPASGELFAAGLPSLKAQLSREAQAAIDEAVQTRDYTKLAYQTAMGEFTRSFFCRADPFPPEFMFRNKHQADDSTVRVSLTGTHSPWILEGFLGSYNFIPYLSQINVPTLLINCEFDTATEAGMMPFFERIPRVRWVTLAGGSHMPHLDSIELRDKVLNFVANFIGMSSDVDSKEN